MSDRLHVCPCAGRTVRDPDADYQPLAAAGGRVRNTPYWRRRLAVGDVETVPAKANTGKSKG